MPIPERQLTIAQRLLEARENGVPEEVRDRLTLNHRVEGNSLIFFETRVAFSRPNEWRESPLAKFQYVQSRSCWKLFWRNSKSRLVTYSPLPEAASFKKLFLEVQVDRYGCFWG